MQTIKNTLCCLLRQACKIQRHRVFRMLLLAFFIPWLQLPFIVSDLRFHEIVYHLVGVWVGILPLTILGSYNWPFPGKARKPGAEAGTRKVPRSIKMLYISGLILAVPGAVLGILLGGLLGYFGFVFYGLVGSSPLWPVTLFMWHYRKETRGE